MDLEILEKIGLSKAEIKVYTTLLGLGSSPSSKIVHETSLRKSTVYDSIRRLQEKGLVSFIIKDSRKGLIARWDMVQLDSFEERFITYKMKSRLKIVGGISLPAAKIKFETRQGIERVTSSNEVNIEGKHERM